MLSNSGRGRAMFGRSKQYRQRRKHMYKAVIEGDEERVRCIVILEAGEQYIEGERPRGNTPTKHR